VKNILHLPAEHFLASDMSGKLFHPVYRQGGNSAVQFGCQLPNVSHKVHGQGHGKHKARPVGSSPGNVNHRFLSAHLLRSLLVLGHYAVRNAVRVNLVLALADGLTQSVNFVLPDCRHFKRLIRQRANGNGVGGKFRVPVRGCSASWLIACLLGLASFLSGIYLAGQRSV
jgi:hypothetical protein